MLVSTERARRYYVLPRPTYIFTMAVFRAEGSTKAKDSIYSAQVFQGIANLELDSLKLHMYLGLDSLGFITNSIIHPACV